MNVEAFGALADPTRRHLIAVLRGGERPVGELVAAVGIQQSGVSRHLRILQDAGFVAMRPDGQRRLYALRPEPFQDLSAWLAPYLSLWQGRLDRFERALVLRQKTRSRKDPR